jgi:hypothetical protein
VDQQSAACLQTDSTRASGSGYSGSSLPAAMEAKIHFPSRMFSQKHLTIPHLNFKFRIRRSLLFDSEHNVSFGAKPNSRNSLASSARRSNLSYNLAAQATNTQKPVRADGDLGAQSGT